jgi:hypothetical protein
MTTRSVSGSPINSAAPPAEPEAAESAQSVDDLQGAPPSDGVDMVGGTPDDLGYATPGGLSLGPAAETAAAVFEPAKDASPELLARTALLFSGLDACVTSATGPG